MRNGMREWCAQGLEWCIERNPMYLLSAGCMAVGARMLLASPSGRAGAIGLILLTLGVLQLYEWAVATVLLVLHRGRRSPEDEPSLLLVAALFWTGPMAATAEMTARGGQAGLAFAVVACAIALVELGVVRRRMGLSLSIWSRLVACVCVMLLAAAPPLLKVPEEVSGTNELFLYGFWWLLAALALLSAGSVRTHLRVTAGGWRGLPTELTFLVAVIGATAAQLYAMNYAFFGHARAFYASPLLVAITVVGLDGLARASNRPGWAIRFVSVVPVVAIMMAADVFDPAVPVRLLPRLLSDPSLLVLVIAGGAWWFGFVRLGSRGMMHAGSAAFALAGWRGAHLFMPGSPQVQRLYELTQPHWQAQVAILLYAVTAYLLLVAIVRRSRIEAVAAVAMHQAAVTCLVLGRFESGVMIIALALCWHWLVCIHLANWWPPTLAVLWPITFLVAVTWAYDFAPSMQWWARSHATAMILVLIGAGCAWPWMRYRAIAGSVGAAHVLFYGARWIGSGQYPGEAAIVMASFVLLAGGMAVSWHKRALLEAARVPQNVACEQTEE